MAIIHQARPMTYQDLLELPDDLYRHELINGEHFMSPSPALKHQAVVGNLYFILRGFVQPRQLGRVFVAPLDVLFSQIDVVEPDVLFVATANAHRLQERYVAGAPDLVVEVLSPSNRRMDRVRKLALYKRQGVPEYWIVDPDAETVDVYRLDTEDGTNRLARMARSPAAIETPLLPDLRIEPADIFAF